MTPRTLARVLAVILLVSLSACAEGEKPNVVVVLIDTLRPDRIGAYGNPRGLTPFLDQLAAQGTVFRNAYSTSSWTSPAVASLFTSRHVSQLRMATFESKLPDDEVTLAERMQRDGYVSAGFLAHFQLSTELGFAQGFASWWTKQDSQIGGDKLREAATAWLDQNATTAGPRLLYFHYLEPHAPYKPRAPFKERFMRTDTGADASAASAKFFRRQWNTVEPAERDLLESLYDGEVAAVDDEIAQMFAELKRRDLLRNAIIVITADHGEEFLEHGRLGHGLSLYNELIRIPLIVVAPGIPGGTVIEENVSLVDVAPTVLDLAGIAAEPRFEGRSLRSLLPQPKQSLFGRVRAALSPAPTPPGPAPDIIVDLESNGAKFDLRFHGQGIVRGSMKLLVPPRGAPVLYDLAADPHERAPIVGRSPHTVDLLQALESAQKGLQSRKGTTAAAPLDDAAREQLRALGYDP